MKKFTGLNKYISVIYNGGRQAIATGTGCNETRYLWFIAHYARNFIFVREWQLGFQLYRMRTSEVKTIYSECFDRQNKYRGSN